MSRPGLFELMFSRRHRYPTAARWHAYRTRTDGVPVPPTPWTGPEPAPHPGMLPPDPRWPVRVSTGQLNADEQARAAGSCAYDTGLCACHGGAGCRASA